MKLATIRNAIQLISTYLDGDEKRMLIGEFCLLAFAIEASNDQRVNGRFMTPGQKKLIEFELISVEKTEGEEYLVLSESSSIESRRKQLQAAGQKGGIVSKRGPVPRDEFQIPAKYQDVFVKHGDNALCKDGVIWLKRIMEALEYWQPALSAVNLDALIETKLELRCSFEEIKTGLLFIDRNTAAKYMITFRSLFFPGKRDRLKTAIYMVRKEMLDKKNDMASVKIKNETSLNELLAPVARKLHKNISELTENDIESNLNPLQLQEYKRKKK